MEWEHCTCRKANGRGDDTHGLWTEIPYQHAIEYAKTVCEICLVYQHNGQWRLLTYIIITYQGCIIRLLWLDVLLSQIAGRGEVGTGYHGYQSNCQQALSKCVTSALSSASEKMHTTFIHSQVCWMIVHILSMLCIVWDFGRNHTL